MTDYHAAAVAVAATFEQRGTERRFLACWVAEDTLTAAIERCMMHHGDPARWWDGLHMFLD